MFSSPLSGRTRPNDRRIRAWLACAGEASRADLARQLDLPKATVAGIVTDLIERGVVAEAPRARPGGAPGRPAHALTLTGPPPAAPAPAPRPPRRPAAPPGRPAHVLPRPGPPPAVAALTWSAGRLRVALATLSGRVLAEHTSSVEPDMAQIGRASCRERGEI